MVFFAFALAGIGGFSVAAMLAGAVVGALLVLHARIVYPLAIALVVLAAVALTALALARAPHAPPSAVP